MDEFKRAYNGAKGTFWVTATILTLLSLRALYDVL